MTAIFADFIDPALDQLVRSKAGFCIWQVGKLVVGNDGSERRMAAADSDVQELVSPAGGKQEVLRQFSIQGGSNVRVRPRPRVNA